jgi:RNA polymerase sigma-70 factor, ECF subfamily
MLSRFKNISFKKDPVLKPSEISDFVRGSEAAFSSIYSKYVDGIRWFVNSRISNLETAEELTQEIFIKVFRFRKAYDGTHAFSTWLWTIAKNSTFDHLRSSRQKHLPAPSVNGKAFSIDEIPCIRDTAESLLLQKDQRKTVFRLLKNLTRLQRRVVWLRLIRHLSYDEIARTLGVSASSVRNIIFRAKLSLSGEALLT